VTDAIFALGALLWVAIHCIIAREPGGLLDRDAHGLPWDVGKTGISFVNLDLGLIFASVSFRGRTGDNPRTYHR